MRLGMLAGAIAAVALFAAPLQGQERVVGTPLEVGVMAYDFELTGSTRFGTISGKVRLSDFRGKTVVLAFFYRARTRG